MVGKRIVNKIYVHKDYMEEAGIPLNKDIVKQISILYPCLPEYNCVRYDKKTNKIALQYSKNFDIVDEPEISTTASIDKNGNVKILIANPNSVQIWHHKWLWVGSDYKGFDVEKSKQRSEMYQRFLKKEDMARIGYAKYWETIRRRWE